MKLHVHFSFNEHGLVLAICDYKILYYFIIILKYYIILLLYYTLKIAQNFQKICFGTKKAHCLTAAKALLAEMSCDIQHAVCNMCNTGFLLLLLIPLGY